MESHEWLHKKILRNLNKIEDWFSQKQKGSFFPFYSSFDLRDAFYKVAPVDANLFPAGFNNICSTDKESAVELASNYLSQYPSCKKILLLTEEHTKNLYYWDNVGAIYDILTASGITVYLSWPQNLDKTFVVKSASGRSFQVEPFELRGAEIYVQGERIDLVVSNNDFSEKVDFWFQEISTPINPPISFGWFQRKKNIFFEKYNCLAEEFCQLLDIDPWHLSIRTSVFENFDIADENSVDRLAEFVENEIKILKEQQRNNSDEPFVFIKNISGTYGLGVLQAFSGEEVKNWNYKAKKKMKASKGGKQIRHLIIQEGIPSALKTDVNEVAEPVLYLIGKELAGGFLRAHKKKGPSENLNSPGAVYKKLCLSDLKVNVEGLPMENIYGWVSRLGVLALSLEISSFPKSCISEF